MAMEPEASIVPDVLLLAPVWLLLPELSELHQQACTLSLLVKAYPAGHVH